MTVNPVKYVTKQPRNIMADITDKLRVVQLQTWLHLGAQTMSMGLALTLSVSQHLPCTLLKLILCGH